MTKIENRSRPYTKIAAFMASHVCSDLFYWAPLHCKSRFEKTFEIQLELSIENCFWTYFCTCVLKAFITSKFWRSGVLTLDSFSRQILKVCILGWVEAQFWKPILDQSKHEYKSGSNSLKYHHSYTNTDLYNNLFLPKYIVKANF